MKTQDETVPGFGRSEAQVTTERQTTEPESSYLPTGTSAHITDRWLHIQSEFVDDPRKSVTEAHQLVGELMQRITESFTEEREQLERQWAGGTGASTEDLRVCLQRYRDFFSRLLPTASEARHTH
jgi:hypothetical protein